MDCESSGPKIQVRGIDLIQIDRGIQPVAAIAYIGNVDQEFGDFALNVEAPVIDARRFAERGSKVVHRVAVAITRAQERRRLVTGRFRNAVVPLKRRTDAVGRGLWKDPLAPKVQPQPPLLVAS